ncbi:MAG: prolyl oligopeptidase family serine peptidase [Planctomycetes bacterium]|nr:prolyl oligopeptidase family serine peptidase [Planctomycetota bacterium]
MQGNMLGVYGDWASQIVRDSAGRSSFRHANRRDVDQWRREARQRFRELLLQPDEPCVPEATVERRLKSDGLEIEWLRWQLPYGPPTEAVFLKPEGATGPLPGVLALHDHGAVKFFGWEKIARLGLDQHPLMDAHQRQYYGGQAWANQLAKRGYAVLAHDAFAFGSRRVRLRDIPPVVREQLGVADVEEVRRESLEDIRRYEAFAAQHEHIMAKSLLCAGTTWPGVFTYEDQRALDYLCSRPEVDSQRLGCCGLSGGGLRTVYLAGLEDRIACACCVGMMTTWRDYLLHTSYTHTWMIYVPGLPREMDYPEILSLMAPKPVLVLNNEQDELFTLDEMKQADRILQTVYRKADASGRYRCLFYPGPHKFDCAMQTAAFQFFDRHLRTDAA